MSKELKPCPFCGSHAFIDSIGEYVTCQKCLADGPYFAGNDDDKTLAIEAWNTRTSHLPDREEVLQEVLKGLRMLALANGETASADWHNGVQAAIGEVSRLSLMERKA